MGEVYRNAEDQFIKEIKKETSECYSELLNSNNINVLHELYELCYSISRIHNSIEKHLRDNRVYSEINEDDIEKIVNLIDGFIKKNNIANIDSFIIVLKKYQPKGKEWNDKTKHTVILEDVSEPPLAYYNLDKLPEKYWEMIRSILCNKSSS